MGKDKTKDGNATTSTDASRDHSWDQESRDATLARTIAEAVALQTKSITDAFTRQMEKTHAQYEELLKASHAQTFLLPLRLLLVQKVSE